MPTCPAGHHTSADDYCDTCGLPIDAGRPGEPVAAPAPAAVGVQCPHCATVNAPDALFCEACGYDFTTGTLPRTATPPVTSAPSAGPVETPSVVEAAQEGPVETQPASEAPQEGPVETQPATETPQDVPVETPRESQAAQQDEKVDSFETQPASETPQGGPVETPPASEAPLVEPVEPPQVQPVETPAPAPSISATPPPAEPWEASAAPDPSPGPLTPHGGRLLHPQPTTVEWVAEVWIDPDWYATQGSTDALPSPGLPEVVPLRATSALIGRVSISRNIHPDLDCDPDTGVSRRHAQVTTDGTRWWIEDLESANGTFVGPSAGPLPTMPIGRGRVEFALDQRLYVGGWTRIVIRRATEDEQQAY
ncbi:MAG: FHA domain-containing protein [Micropruina sp.]|nr:FHA domain-containing protein [Micropruina sp.]